MGVTLISLRRLAVEQELDHCNRMLLQDRCPADVLTQMLRQDCDVTRIHPGRNCSEFDRKRQISAAIERCWFAAKPGMARQ